MGKITLSNSGGSLEFDAIAWSEEQSCDIATRKVPMRIEGDIVDTGTYVLKARTLSLSLRLTDADKQTLQNIYNSKTQITIVATQDGTEHYWVYTGWFNSKPETYEASHNGTELREWVSALQFKIDSIDFTEPQATEKIVNGGFEDGDEWTVTGWTGSPNIEYGDYYDGIRSVGIYELTISQIVDLNISVENIQSFGFWYKTSGTNTDSSFGIIFTDDTTVGDIITVDNPTEWTYIDLMPYLVTGKSVKNITIHGGSGSFSYTDGVSLMAFG